MLLLVCWELRSKIAPSCYGLLASMCIPYRGMCPKNSAILLRLICWKQPLTSNAVQETAQFCAPPVWTCGQIGVLMPLLVCWELRSKIAPSCYGLFLLCAYRLTGHVPKEQRHFVTADLLEATAHKQCCPRNSAILLRAFLSSHCTTGVDMRPNWRPYAIAGLLGVTIQNSTFLLRAFGFYVHTDYLGMCPKNSAILLRPICWKQQLTSNAVQETAPFCYGRFFLVIAPPGWTCKLIRRHHAPAALLEVTMHNNVV